MEHRRLIKLLLRCFFLASLTARTESVCKEREIDGPYPPPPPPDRLEVCCNESSIRGKLVGNNFVRTWQGLSFRCYNESTLVESGNLYIEDDENQTTETKQLEATVKRCDIIFEYYPLYDYYYSVNEELSVECSDIMQASSSLPPLSSMPPFPLPSSETDSIMLITTNNNPTISPSLPSSLPLSSSLSAFPSSEEFGTDDMVSTYHTMSSQKTVQFQLAAIVAVGIILLLISASLLLAFCFSYKRYHEYKNQQSQQKILDDIYYCEKISVDIDPLDFDAMMVTLSLESVNTLVYPMERYSPCNLGNEVSSQKDMENIEEEDGTKSCNTARFDSVFDGYINICTACKHENVKKECCYHFQASINQPQSEANSSISANISSGLNPDSYSTKNDNRILHSDLVDDDSGIAF